MYLFLLLIYCIIFTAKLELKTELKLRILFKFKYYIYGYDKIKMGKCSISNLRTLHQGQQNYTSVKQLNQILDIT